MKSSAIKRLKSINISKCDESPYPQVLEYLLNFGVNLEYLTLKQYEVTSVTTV